ncbi:unnamed protein product [Clonostachys rosea]|uniref:PAS domain-containing protein n=1 Tax=Bionectria ochroleuca TaxID=29856 RepID=A0ABY6V2K7_BIOOC|nr:unnamed protein product [Clonostachys rosea]
MAFKAVPPVNPWEVQALNVGTPLHLAFPCSKANLAYCLQQYTLPAQKLVQTTPSPYPPVRDDLIYPGLYSGTGFDLMSILLQVAGRPHPSVDLGPVDCSVAVIVSDLELPDMPIVYASDAFCQLTGYSQHEILGQNCRFLQTPSPGSPPTSTAAAAANKAALQHLRQAVYAQQEIQTRICNYKKDGQPFTNFLTVIPIQLHGRRYSVGFQCEDDE